MDAFVITEIGDRSHRIVVEGDSTCYVVEGDERAAVIDTGIAMGKKLMPAVRSVTSKPVILVLTHAHIDHMHHMDEFETVYLCHEEFKLPPDFLHEHMAGKDLNLAGTHHIETGSRIDLGGRCLEVFQVPGHTPGSVVLWDETEDYLYTGDAIGSGAGVWMQLPGRSKLTDYATNLRALLKWLVDKGGKTMFWSGHYGQRYASQKIPGDNPLSIGLLADLCDLVERTADGQIMGKAVDLPPHARPEGAMYVAFGRAEMICAPGDIQQGTDILAPGT